jgi:hypothetical protein
MLIVFKCVCVCVCVRACAWMCDCAMKTVISDYVAVVMISRRKSI